MNSENQSHGSVPFLQRRVVQVLSFTAILGALIVLYILLKDPALNLTTFTLERQSKSFLLVSTLKSSLAVIEGSDIGVGFRVELGDMVQSVYDLVDFTWKILLYGILIITFNKLIFDSNLIDVGAYILGLGFMMRIASLFIKTYRTKITALGSGIIVAGLIVAFYIPVSTFVSFRACEFFVDHIERDLDTQMQQALEEWETFKNDLSVTKLKTSIRSTAAFVKALFLKLTRILITYTCLIIIRYLLFPLIVAYGFYVLSKAFLQKRLE